MPLPAWVLALAFTPSTLIFGYIVWRWERRSWWGLVMSSTMIFLYSLFAIAHIVPPQTSVIARDIFIFVTTFLDYIAIEILLNHLKGERRGS